ncbi:MAG: hypothetical protein RR905_06310, partial [Aurantimicrobium sp.]
MSQLLTNLKPSGSRADKVEQAYRERPQDEREALAEAFNDESFTSTDIANALNSVGYNISGSQVVHFRK